jgi:hypothetical protein
LSSLLENHLLPVVCPHCGAQIQKTMSWFRDNKEMLCPCGTIYLVTDELIPIIDALEAAIMRLIRPAPETTRD